MARLRASQVEMEKWYIRGLPGALGLGVLGLVAGLLVNLLLAAFGHGHLSIIPIAGAAAFAGRYVVMAIVELSGAAGGTIYGGSPATSSVPDYSYPDSLAARGLYDAAVAAYRNAAEEHPDSPEPLLRAARVLRDALHRYSEAVELFREVRAHPGADEGLEELVTREIAEVHIRRLGDPARALPELARLVDRHPGSPGAEWARRLMAELKAELWQTVKAPDPEA